MAWFDFLRKKKKQAPAPSPAPEYKPTPAPSPNRAPAPRPDPKGDTVPLGGVVQQAWRSWREDYLARLGKAEEADRLFTFRVLRPDGGETELELRGIQDKDEALNALQETGFIRPGEYLTFASWPRADYNAVGHFTRSSACACELETRVLRLAEYDPEEERRKAMVCLYGCPNAKELTDRPLPKTVEVLDYA